MSLFNTGTFRLHAGGVSNFKIDCDHLSDEDIQAVADLVGPKLFFHTVIGVPTGGLRFARALEKYSQPGGSDAPLLIVDDVLTTGVSMEQAKKEHMWYTPPIGVVIFARGKCPDWVTPIFQMLDETPNDRP